MIADSGDFARRVDARARAAFEIANPGERWDAAGDGQLPWIGAARTEELQLDPSGSIEDQRGEVAP